MTDNTNNTSTIPLPPNCFQLPEGAKMPDLWYLDIDDGRNGHELTCHFDPASAQSMGQKALESLHQRGLVNAQYKVTHIPSDTWGASPPLP